MQHAPAPACDGPPLSKTCLSKTYPQSEFCPKCPPSLSRRQFTGRNRLLRHLTSKKHGMSKEDARRMAYGEEVPEENPNKVSEEIPEENPDKVSEEITNNDEVKK